MQIEVSIAEAKAKFSDLIHRAAYGGERIVITKRGRPVAILSGATADAGLGSVKGWLDDHDAFFTDIAKVQKTRRGKKLRASGGIQ